MPKKVENNLIVGLDIGTSKVVAIVADIAADNSIEIIGIGSHPSRGMKKGVVVNIDATVQSIQRAVEEAELMSGCQIHSVYTGIAGSHIRSLNSHGIVAIKGDTVQQSDVTQVIDAAKAVAIPADQKILHIIPQEFKIDHQEGIHEPVGMSGVRLEANIHMITGAVSAAQNIINCIRKCYLEVDDIVLEQLASSHAVLTDDERNLGVCMIDIGGGTTDIAVYIDGSIKHTAVFPIAGDQVTNDIAVAMRTPTASAESIKIQYGCAISRASDPNIKIKVPAVGQHSTKEINQMELSHIIEPRFDELFGFVQSELSRSGLNLQLGAGVVLTGGSSCMDGLVDLAADVFETSVRIGTPRNVTGMEDIIENPIFSTGVGLILQGLANQQESESKRKQKHSNPSVFGKVKNWFAGNF